MKIIGTYLIYTHKYVEKVTLRYINDSFFHFLPKNKDVIRFVFVSLVSARLPWAVSFFYLDAYFVLVLYFIAGNHNHLPLTGAQSLFCTHKRRESSILFVRDVHKKCGLFEEDFLSILVTYLIQIINTGKIRCIAPTYIPSNQLNPLCMKQLG